MKTQKLTAGLGAVIDGLDLETLDVAGLMALQGALMEHQVIFLRRQRLSDDGHRALAAALGTPAVHPVTKHFGGTEYLHHIEDTPTSPPDADLWHTDITWVASPPKAAILYAEVIPPYGGDTLWASLYGAWEQLSPTLQDMLRPLQVLHTPGEKFWERMKDAPQGDQVDQLRQVFPGAVHPLVRSHPVTGRTVLNLSGTFMDSVVGMNPDESAWLLNRLMSLIDDPNLQVRWTWQEGDVAIWDEYSTVHRAMADHFPQHRRMRRCTVDA